MVTTKGLGQVRLPDGRRVDTWHGGDPTGSPVLYFHGTPAGRLQAALGDGAAHRAGVRLLAFSRPGYGGSGDVSTTLSSVAQDAVDVAAELGIERFACLGASGGGPYALATAATHPEAVTAVGVVAGIGPVLELDEAAIDDPAIRMALDGDVDGAVELNDAALASGAAGAAGAAQQLRDVPATVARPDGDATLAPPDGDHATPDRPPHSHPTHAAYAWMSDSHLRHSGHRPGSFVSPEILEPWMPGGRPGVPSYRGVSRDTVAFAVGWDFDLASVVAPVWLWYGDHDRMVPIAHGRWLHERLPTSTLVVREGAGHHGTLLPYWSQILTILGRAGS
ncbi:alpha/beta hydrolase [Monashia sp. NPDC004114]